MNYHQYYQWPNIKYNLKAWQLCKACNRYSVVKNVYGKNGVICAKCETFYESDYDTILTNLGQPEQVKVFEEKNGSTWTRSHYLVTIGGKWAIIDVFIEDDVNWDDWMGRPCEDTAHIDCMAYINEASARREWKIGGACSACR